MGDYATLKAGITANIKQNDSQAITGNILQGQLLAMVDALGAGYQFMGIATPETDPETPDARVFYLASTPGTYTNFGGLVLSDGEIAILKWDTTWHKDVTGIASLQDIEERGSYIVNTEWVQVVTDKNDKILFGVKTDGKFYFGDGCPPQIKALLDEKLNSAGLDSSALETMQLIDAYQFIQATTDENGKIIEGIKSDGTKVFESPVERPMQRIEEIDNPTFIDVTTDSKGRVIEGITRDGKKRIGDFDDYTKEVIREITGDGSSIGNIISIPALDANFTSPVPVTVTGTKGDASAKYEFVLPLKDSWNVRVKCKLKEDLIKNNNTATIAKINGASVIAHPIALSQCVTDSDNEAVYGPYSGTPFQDAWPAYAGGVAFNAESIDSIFGKKNIGRQAFSVRYIGNGSSATVENTGDALVFNIDGVEKSFSFATYPTVNELFAALDADSDFEVAPIALDYHNCSELAVFAEIQLISNLHGNTNQEYKPPIIEYTDNGPLYLHYAINEDWHQIEIVKLGNKVYSVCDGNVVVYSDLTDENILTLGGECGVLFKELEIFTDSISDFEYIDNTPISSVNPYIVIFEAHDVNLDPTYQQPIVGNTGYNQNIDTLDWAFARCKDKGYTPVSIEDIARYYICGDRLPKRCYTIVLDGWHWNTIMNIMKRSVFLKYGVIPAFGIEKRDVVVTPIEHNGQTITIAEATKIAKTIGFSVISHTINHTSTYAVKPSDRVAFVSAQVYDFEPDGIDGQIYVFPGGCTDPYMNEVFEYLGMKAGIEIVRGGLNNISRNRFALGRLDISTVYKYDGENWIKINYNPGKLIKVI